MTQQEKEELKYIIQTEISALADEIASLEDALKPIKKDCSLDSIDHKMLKQDQNVNIQRYEVAKQRLNRLKAAFLTIDNKEYGVCQECEEDINIERLKLIPESKYCVSRMNELGL